MKSIESLVSLSAKVDFECRVSNQLITSSWWEYNMLLFYSRLIDWLTDWFSTLFGALIFTIIHMNQKYSNI